MKILLIGEFSSLHKYLKDGLVALGHHVTLAATGDGFKKIDCDINMTSKLPGIFGKIHSLLRMICLAISTKQYDVIQIVQPCPFPANYVINKLLLRIVFYRGKKVFLAGAGADNLNTYIADFRQQKFKYTQYYQILLSTCGNFDNQLYSQTSKGRKYHSWLHNKIYGYIPIMYEYAEPYRITKYNKLLKTIPIPINLETVEYQPNLIHEKLVIFHGLNRSENKGTPIIKEAMERLKQNYPNEVEIIIDGKMPLKKYLEIMKQTNICIDQVYSCSSGVNGLLSMAMGKVTLGGGEPECLKEFNITKCPMIPIEPTADDIYNKLEWLIKNKELIPSISKESREYVEKIHNYKIIASKYIETWRDTNYELNCSQL